jgi:hypothetical protein
MIVQNVANTDFLSISIIVGGKNKNILPTYLLIHVGQIAESERGKRIL